MSLKKRAIAGAKWTTASTVLVSIFQFIQLTILARLLGSSAFGLIGMVMVVVGFANAFADMGMSNAIIHRQDTTKQQLSSLYWLNLFTGIVVCCTVILISPLIVEFFQEPQLQNLLIFTSAIFLITPIGQQFQMLLQKELNFDRLAKIEVMSSFFGTVIAISSALLGFGALSLVFGQLGSTSLKSVNLATVGWRTWKPSLHFDIADLKGYLGFGMYQMGERSINYFSANIDTILVGRLLGAEVLGLYTVAYQLIITPLRKINPILTRVAFPVFAKIQSDNLSLISGYNQMIKLLGYLSCPLLIGLAVTAPLLVPALFGDGWEQTIFLVQVLSVVGILKMLSNPGGSLLLAKGYANIGFYWNLLYTIFAAVIFYIVIPYGIQVFVLAYAAMSIIIFFVYSSLLFYVIEMQWITFAKSFYRVILINGVFTILLVLSQRLIGDGVSNIAELVSTIVIGMGIYLALIVLLEKDYILELLSFIIPKAKEKTAEDVFTKPP